MNSLINSFLILICCLFQLIVYAQNGSVSGSISEDESPIQFVNIVLDGTDHSTITGENGEFSLDNIPYGEYTLYASYTGYKEVEKSVIIDKNSPHINLSIEMVPLNKLLDEVVVTGTKTFKKKTESAVIVNVLDSETLDNVKACDVSESLKFQAGMRVETDCQTCNYTQLRMNGLGGGYSQILINGRAIFSPLTGLYGLEQIPTNMVDRIEIVRGGGSALYGSSAIGGTVNIITRIPEENSYNIESTFRSINGQTSENITMGNLTTVTENKKAGASIFINRRTRGLYDHNNDNFSEIPSLENNSFGANLFYLPTENQKLELNFTSLYEYRYGGEMVDKAAHLAKQSEERTHNVLLGSIDYQLNWNNERSSIIANFAAQNTERDHFTGILPQEQEAKENYLLNPPYGISSTTTYQGTFQINHTIDKGLFKENTLTAGLDYVRDDVLDSIGTYNYKVDQLTQNIGTFVQSDWAITPSFTLLSGVRMDYHNLVDEPIFSPRLSMLYKFLQGPQLRLTYAQGFRAPQAFDTDLHIAFAGGGVSRIQLADDLNEEKSHSISASINYDKVTEKFIAGFTLEGFYTRLNDAFQLTEVGEDSFGKLFRKTNGQSSTVQGATIELRANYDQKIQLEGGFTYQSSRFQNAVENIEGLESKRRFLRTPDEYGYGVLTILPSGKWTTTLNYVFTGDMLISHFAGAPEQSVDEYVTTPTFHEFSLKSEYTIDIGSMGSALQIFGGINNIFNAYQDDFDSGRNRDSNYIYGPSRPRTFFIGLGVKSL